MKTGSGVHEKEEVTQELHKPILHKVYARFEYNI